jgi:hypothetical protein
MVYSAGIEKAQIWDFVAFPLVMAEPIHAA